MDGDDATIRIRRSRRSTANHLRLDVDALDENCLDWLLDGQSTETNAYTGAAAGGWAWTDLPGGVPEAVDTANALLALAHWRHRYPHLKSHRLELAARRGVEWLLDLQNRDGGWPTFCRGWSLLTFDRSGCDVTALVIRALAAWEEAWHADAHTANLPEELGERITAAITKAWHFLEDEQHNDGSFVPLWFGNQYHPEGHNLVYGTAQVLIACRELGRLDGDMAQRAARWLLGVQHANGGWGPPRSSPATSLSNIYRSGTSRAEDALASFCSVEETSLAIEALLPLVESNQLHARAVKNGLKWLVDAVEQGRLRQPSPIGFYFAKLWYQERLYPLVFAASALRQAVRQVCSAAAAVAPLCRWRDEWPGRMSDVANLTRAAISPRPPADHPSRCEPRFPRYDRRRPILRECGPAGVVVLRRPGGAGQIHAVSSRRVARGKPAAARP